MPRRPRIKLAGLPQHVVQRGINREPCLFAEEDYHSYLHWLEKAAADRQTAYRALFCSELDEGALGDIRLALSQGKPLGHGRFGDRICAAADVRRAQKRPGRPAGKSDQSGDSDAQTGFGF